MATGVGIGAGSAHIATVYGKRKEANAALIAAAPELLEALKGLVSIGWNDGPLAKAYEKEVLAAESAIAKAEGMEPRS